MIRIDDEEIKHINEKLDNSKADEEKDEYSFGFFASY